VCPLLLRPICGSDGVTYPNDCQLEVSNCKNGTNVTMTHGGACEDQQFEAIEAEVDCATLTCDGEPTDQLCGTDGVTYANECHLKKASCSSSLPVSVSYRGPCAAGAAAARCPILCPDDNVKVWYINFDVADWLCDKTIN
jgi:coxsackievirus/adenovirus receptor